MEVIEASPAEARAPSPPRKPSIVYTFYSYKGGVGRSMALANVAALLAKWGRKVLVVDWDLEAPGLEKYFMGGFSDLPPDARKQKPGLIQLILKQRAGTPLDWHKCVHEVKLRDTLKPVSLITAGLDEPDYVKHVQGLDWAELFAKHRIGNYLEALRGEWLREFDFVLIDSRTGISDIGGICTILLPDVLVLMFTSNFQSIDGCADIVQRARAGQAQLAIDRPKLFAVPVPARDERDAVSYLGDPQSRGNDVQEWLTRYEGKFGVLLKEWLPERVQPQQALQKLYIPYLAKWSFGERLPVIEEGRLEDARSISASFARLARLLDNRLDWNALELQTGEAHELDAAKAEAALASQKAEEEAARSVILQEQLAQQALDAQGKAAEATRIRRWTRIAAVVLITAFAAGLIYNDIHSKKQTQLARADRLVTAATAAEDPLAAQLLIAELGNLPQPDSGIDRARSAMPVIAPLAVVSAASVKSNVVRVRLSANGSRVAAVYADGSARHWPANGRGDATELHSKLGRFQDLALGQDPATIRAAVVDDDESHVFVVDISGDGKETQIGQGSTAIAEHFIGAEFVLAGTALLIEGGSGQSAGRERAIVWSVSKLAPDLQEALVTRRAVTSIDGKQFATRPNAFEKGRAERSSSSKAPSDGNVDVLAIGAMGAETVLIEARKASLVALVGDDKRQVAQTKVGPAVDGVEIAHGDVIAFNDTNGTPQRGWLWPLAPPWPAELGSATPIRQRQPSLPIHDISVDGSKLATASADGSIWVWPIEDPHDIAAKDWEALVRWARESTTACLSVDQRMRLLGESFEDAVKAYEACETSFGRTPHAPPRQSAEQTKK